jgi:hypothetical protein
MEQRANWGAVCGQDKLRFLDTARLLRDALGISTTLSLRDPLQNQPLSLSYPSLAQCNDQSPDSTN